MPAICHALKRILIERGRHGASLVYVAHDLVMKVIESFSRDRNIEPDFANDL